MEDISQKLLNAIKNTYEKEVSLNNQIKSISEKIKKGTADYSDMLQYSKELGNCVKKAFQVNISDDVLPDSKMYYDIAKTLIEPMCQQNYKQIAAHCAVVQTSLNKQANIGLKGIKPTYKEEKTKGIVNCISSAEKYSDKEASFLNSLVTNAKSIVDDSVKENADFHLKSGLSPKIIRRTSGKTCKWCQSLAGVYDYADVNNTGNSVFKRHANCDCVVLYDPANGSKKVQDVWNKKWNDQSKLDVIQNRLENIHKEVKQNLPKGVADVTKIYLSKATPGKGIIKDADFVIIKGKTYYTNKINKIEHKNNEVEVAKWLKETLGGDIYYLPRITQEDGIKTADYLWNNEFWDLKEIFGNGKNTLYHAVENKKGQSNNFIFDVSGSKLNDKQIEDQIVSIYRLNKTKFVDTILVKRGNKILRVYKRK
jgi:hypothetical protein